MTSAVPKLVPDSRPISIDREVRFHRTRREPRSDEVRCAQYTPFPRVRANQTPRRGFTRDVSPLGMCLGVDLPERIGALLRVEVHSLDGRSIGATVARVAWCRAARDGRYWIGLDLLCAPDGARPQWHVGARVDAND